MHDQRNQAAIEQRIKGKRALNETLRAFPTMTKTSSPRSRNRWKQRLAMRPSQSRSLGLLHPQCLEHRIHRIGIKRGLEFREQFARNGRNIHDAGHG